MSVVAINREPKKYSIEWWRSDEAMPHRLARYLGDALRWAPDAKKELAAKGNAAPEWPAILVYCIETDEAIWVKCESRTQIRDYVRVFPEWANAAAMALIA